MVHVKHTVHSYLRTQPQLLSLSLTARKVIECLFVVCHSAQSASWSWGSEATQNVFMTIVIAILNILIILNILTITLNIILTIILNILNILHSRFLHSVCVDSAV